MSLATSVQRYLVPVTGLHSALELVADVLLGLLGGWAIYHWFLVYALAANFTAFASLAAVPLGLASGYLVLTRRSRRAGAPPCCPCNGAAGPALRARRLYAGGALLAAVAVALAFVTATPYLMLWAILLPLMGFAWLLPAAAVRAPDPGGQALSRLDGVLLILLCLVVAYSTGAANRADGDDAFYVNIIASALSNPHLPIFGYDHLLNEGLAAAPHPSYKVSAYETLVATLSYWSGIDHLVVYYNVLPILSALCWAILATLFTAALGVRFPVVAVAATFLVLVIWGGSHYSFGNFSFVRLYQGKAMLATLGAPLIWWATARFLRHGTPGDWLRVSFAVLAAASLSGTGLFVVPISLAVAFMVLAPVSRQAAARGAQLAIAALPLAAVLFLTVLETRAFPGREYFDAGSILENGEVFGDVPAQVLFLISLVWLAIFARYACELALASRLLRFSLVGVLAFLAPGFGPLVAELSGVAVLSWRVQWAFPVAFVPGLLAALALSCIITSATQSRRQAYRHGALFAVVAAIWLALFAVSQKTPTRAFLPLDVHSFTAPKIPAKQYEEACAIHAAIPAQAYIVAPQSHAGILSRLRPPPQFVSLRHYLDQIRYALPEQEYRERIALQSIVDTLEPLERGNGPLGVAWVIATAKRLGVQALVFSAARDGRERTAGQRSDAFSAQLRAGLVAAGYDCAATPSAEHVVCNADSGSSVLGRGR